MARSSAHTTQKVARFQCTWIWVSIAHISTNSYRCIGTVFFLCLVSVCSTKPSGCCVHLIWIQLCAPFFVVVFACYCFYTAMCLSVYVRTFFFAIFAALTKLSFVIWLKSNRIFSSHLSYVRVPSLNDQKIEEWHRFYAMSILGSFSALISPQFPTSLATHSYQIDTQEILAIFFFSNIPPKWMCSQLLRA